MKTFLIILILFIILVLSFYFWASYSNLYTGFQEGEIKNLNKNLSNSPELKVLTWNLSYAHGLGSEGENYKRHDKDIYLKNLDEMASIIRESEADIILLQEVDFKSKRTYDIDQAEYLAAKGNYSYIAYAPSWENNYIPYPYFPMSEHFGKMYSGGAILSRYKILKNEIYLFPKPMENPFYYNAFYLHRFFQMVTIEYNGKNHYVGNVHLEAFKKETRMTEAKKIVDIIDAKSDKPWLFIGGDFNTLPTEASKRSHFKGYPEDDYEGDETYEIISKGLKNLYDPEEKMPLTFPSNEPDRKLDFIFINKKYSRSQTVAIESGISDHFPYFVEIIQP